MSQRGRTGIMLSSVSVAVVMAAVYLVVVLSAKGVTQEERAAMPALFAPTYSEGHDLAGFAGKPMVLVFGDSRAAGWNEFLAECEKDPKVSGLLTETFQGVFVDAAKEGEVFITYADPTVGTVLVKDLHGPIRGRLEGEYTCGDLAAVLEEALPEVRVEKSPAYWRLLNGTDLLDELVQKEETIEAERVLKLFRRFESGSKPFEDALRKGADLGLRLPAE